MRRITALEPSPTRHTMGRPHGRTEETLEDRLLRLLSFLDVLEQEDPSRAPACERQRTTVVDALMALAR